MGKLWLSGLVISRAEARRWQKGFCGELVAFIHFAKVVGMSEVGTGRLKRWGLWFLMTLLGVGVFFAGRDALTGRARRGDLEVGEPVRRPDQVRRKGSERRGVRRSERGLLADRKAQISRAVVGGNWRVILEKVPVRYSGGAVELVEASWGGQEVESFMKDGELFWAMDLMAAQYDFSESEREFFGDWLVDFRARLFQAEITDKAATFEYKGKEMAIIGANHLEEVLLPERWVVKAEKAFCEESGVLENAGRVAEDLARGQAWQRDLGLSAEEREVGVGLSAEQWEAMEGRTLEEGIVFLREDQLFRLTWMSESFRKLVEK